MATTAPAAPPSGQRAEHIYPTLTPAQLARIAAHGRRRQVERGEVLVEAGEQNAPLFVLAAGRGAHFPSPAGGGGALGLVCAPGFFCGGTHPARPPGRAPSPPRERARGTAA